MATAQKRYIYTPSLKFMILGIAELQHGNGQNTLERWEKKYRRSWIQIFWKYIIRLGNWTIIYVWSSSWLWYIEYLMHIMDYTSNFQMKYKEISMWLFPRAVTETILSTIHEKNVSQATLHHCLILIHLKSTFNFLSSFRYKNICIMIYEVWSAFSSIPS